MKNSRRAPAGPVGLGTAVITGEAKSLGTLPEDMRNPGGINKEATASTRGRAAGSVAWTDGKDTRVRASEYDTARTARST